MASRGNRRQQPAVNAAIVDTDVVLMLFKGDTRAIAYRAHITGKLLGISFMTLTELTRWALERACGTLRKLELAQHPTHYTVLPVSRELCIKWAEVSFGSQKTGAPDSNRRRVDCGECPLLSGSPDYKQSKRLLRG